MRSSNRSRTIRAVQVTFALVGAMVVFGGTGAEALCVGPTVSVDNSEVGPGGALVVRGEFFGDECNDTGPTPPDGPDFGTPYSSISLTIERNDGTPPIVFATVDADDRYAFEVGSTAPADAGVYEISAQLPDGTFVNPATIQVIGGDPVPASPPQSATPTFTG